MKKVSLILIISLILSSTVAFASIEDKLSNHWSRDQLNVEFINQNFPYLSRDSYAAFGPNKDMLEIYFNLSTAAVFKNRGLEVSGLGRENPITRARMAQDLGKKLSSLGFDQKVEGLPFIDIRNVSEETIEGLRILYNYGIVIGSPEGQFMPTKKLSQAESIIILQRLDRLLREENEIDFKLVGIVESHNAQEELIVNDRGDKVLLTITKEFPTPGYSLNVDSIIKNKNVFKIKLTTKNPPRDSMQAQVITYKTISLEIDKSQLGEAPYNFIVEGYN